MGKIFCLMGKSSTGKDTIYKRLLEDQELGLQRIVPYTTRPIREGEQEGVEYHFVSEETLQCLEQEGRVVELRAYDTVCGVWKYFTVCDEHMNLEKESYAVIGTLDSWNAMKRYFGDQVMVPVYVDGKKRLFHRTRLIIGHPVAPVYTGRHGTAEEMQEIADEVLRRAYALGGETL